MLRNARIHIKRKGDMNKDDHNKLLNKINKLVWKDPEYPLPRHKHLLDNDFGALGRASGINHLLWVAEVEASMTAANHGITGSKNNEQADDITRDSNLTQAAKIVTGPKEQDIKGNGAWKIERWK